MCERAQHLPDTLISVCIYIETWNLNVAVAYLPPPTAEDCWKNSNSFHIHHLKWNTRYNRLLILGCFMAFLHQLSVIFTVNNFM